MYFKSARAALSWILVVVMLIPAGLAGSAGRAAEVSYIVIEPALPLDQKIDPKVRASFAEEGYVEVLVKLTRQVDTQRVAQAALGRLPSSRQDRIEVRKAVVDRLRSNAQESQQGLLRYLQREQLKGTVLEYQSFYIVNVIFIKAAPAVVEQLARRPDVQMILPNEQIPFNLPEEEESAAGIELLAVEWGVSRINAPGVWDLGYDGSGVVVGIIDSGVEWEHPALKTRWRGYNPDDPANPDPAYNWYDATTPKSTLPKDAHSHGTHVTGTVLGQAGANQIGVAPGAQWIAARIFGDDHLGVSTNLLIDACEFMIAPTDSQGENPRPDLAPDIVNNSWGFTESGPYTLFQAVVQAWRDAQILPVFAAGNLSSGAGPGSILPPASFPESFAVAALDSSNNLAAFSRRGPGPYGDMIKPEISAPGVLIRSALLNGTYGNKSGTSMAAPHIAGTAALMRSANPRLTVDELEQYLIDTAVALTDSTYPESPNYGFGYGLVDALAAVNTARQASITGHVLAKGVDDQSPVIEHQQSTDFAFAGFNIPVEASVSDNISVTKVTALVRRGGEGPWSEAPMYRFTGDHLAGDYWGQIPWERVEEPYLEYKITAEDFAGNRTETGLYRVEVSLGLQPGWSEDFSEEPPHWYWSGDWERGLPTVGPVPQFGDKLMGTNLSGNYSDDSYSYILLPPLDLRNESLPGLRLDHWYDIEPDTDFAVIAISADYGESWDEYFFTGHDQQWRTTYLNLSPYAGSPNPVLILFELYTDGALHYPGWYIDRVEVDELAHSNLYFSDFESNNGQFTVSTETGFSSSWKWAVPSGIPGPGTAYSGQKLWATNPADHYTQNNNSVIWSLPISLSGRDNSYIEFYHWYEIEAPDYGCLLVYTPDDEISRRFDIDYSGAKTFWSRDTYDLRWFLENGFEEIHVGFYFISDSSAVTLPGWYLDDVRVYYTQGMSTLSAKGSSAPVPVQITPQGLIPLQQLEPLQEAKQGAAPGSLITREIPVRQPLQGPQPLLQTLSDIAEPNLCWLPVEATLTILETGLSTTTNPGDGSYRLNHPPAEPGQTLTLQVVAEGYNTETRQICLADMEMQYHIFLLGIELTAGDVNRDSFVKVDDAILLLRFLVGLHTFGYEARLAADVNLDGRVDVTDAILILRYLVGLAPSL